MSSEWLVYVTLFILVSDCNSNKHSLLPTTMESNIHSLLLTTMESKHSVDKNETSKIKRELKVTVSYEFPDSVTLCNKTHWDTYGWNAKLIKIMSYKLGIYRCTSLNELKDMDIDTSARQIDYYSGYEFLYPHFRSSLCVVVQRRIPVSYTLIDILLLSGTMNIILMVYLVLCTLTLHLLGLRPAALYVFKTFITGSFPSDHQPPVRKFLLITLSITSVILLTALSGMYTSKLAVQKDVRQIQTLEEVNDVITGFGVSEDELHYYREVGLNKDDILSKLLAKHVIIPTDVGTRLAMVRNITKTTKFGAFFVTHRVDFLTLLDMNLLDDDGRPLSHIVPDYIVSPFYYSFRVNRGWPLYGKFNNMLMRLVEAGVVNYLYKETPYDYWKGGAFTRQQLPNKTPNTSTEPKALILKDIHEQFVILIVGLVLASTIFTTENVIHKLNTLCNRSGSRNIKKKSMAMLFAKKR